MKFITISGKKFHRNKLISINPSYILHISIVSPVYKAPEILPELVARLEESLTKITDSFEIILVDDGCPWDSWSVVEQLAEKYSFIKGIKLSRNFGQHYAITAGLDYSKGEWVVVMDCDLQDRPDEIQKLYKEAQNGFDIVLAARENRQDNIFKKFTSSLFFRIYFYLCDLDSDHIISNFGMYNQKVIIEFNKLLEVSRSFPSLIQQLGFKKSIIKVKHSIRFEGKTSYSFFKLLNLAMDIFLSNSNKPLKLTVVLGFIISFGSFFLAAYNLFAGITGIITVPGFTSTIFSIWFVGGLILFVLGVMGLYLGKIFDQVKGRGLYIIEKKINIVSVIN
jgi:dolichol-phosphate mannosyltransferase